MKIFLLIFFIMQECFCKMHSILFETKSNVEFPMKKKKIHKDLVTNQTSDANRSLSIFNESIRIYSFIFRTHLCAFFASIYFKLRKNGKKTFSKNQNKRRRFSSLGMWGKLVFVLLKKIYVYRSFPLFCHACKIRTKEQSNLRRYG